MLEGVKLFFQKIINRKAILLPPRPLVTHGLIARAAVKQIGDIPKEWTLYLVGVRNYYRADAKDRKNNYNDAIFVVYKGQVVPFNFNVDSFGCRKVNGTLRSGVHWYKKGLHGISRPNPYNALKQATPDKSLLANSKGVTFDIHRGGANGSPNLKPQVLPPEQWIEFQTLVYKLMDESNVGKIPYVLLNGQIG